MAYADLLINSCTVLEDTGGGADGYGGIVPDWTEVAGQVGIDCRLMASSGREVMVGAEVVVADYKLFLGDIAITEQNRVDVYDVATTTWIRYEILLVSNMQDSAISHHKECWLRTVR